MRFWKRRFSTRRPSTVSASARRASNLMWRHRFQPRIEYMEDRVVPSVIDFSGGFSNSGLHFNSYRGGIGFAGSGIRLTNGGGDQQNSVFTTYRVDISKD